MKKLIELLNDDAIKGKRNKVFAELLYNKNGIVRTSNLHYINSAYDLSDKYNLNLSIKRVDYSADHIIKFV